VGAIVRVALETALADCAVTREKAEVRRFLTGLSKDELRYIAEFLGVCLMEPARFPFRDFGEALESIVAFGCAQHRPFDRDHKSLVLMEYLRRAGLRETPLAMRAGAG
jgi:hypothetical protein